MEVLLNMLVGVVIVPVYTAIKKGLHLQGQSAAWVLVFLTLIIAAPMAIFTGQLAGIGFDLANPFEFLKAVSQAFLVILGSAEGLYMLIKKRR